MLKMGTCFLTRLDCCVTPEYQSYKLYLQVMEKLVDIVHFLHLEIHDAFGTAGMHF